MLHHLIASTARTSPRSLFAKANASIYVSSHRALAAQKESMLRHLFISAARMNSRSLFTKPNVSSYVSSLRTFSDQKDRLASDKNSAEKKKSSENREGLAMLLMLFWFSVVLAVILSRNKKEVKRECRIEFHPKPATSDSIPVDAAVQSTKKPDAFKHAKVKLFLEMPHFQGYEDTNICLPFKLHIDLPDVGLGRELEAMHFIHDGLASEGIHVEFTLRGLRRGLAKYALKQMCDAFDMHSEKKGDCDHFPVPSQEYKAPPNSRITTVDTTKLMSFSEPVDAAAQSIKKSGPFKDAHVKLLMDPLQIIENRDDTNIRISASLRVHLPNLAYLTTFQPDTTEFKQICDELERQGIHVDRTKEGVHRGLTEYALKQMHDTVNERFKKIGSVAKSDANTQAPSH